jgi:integrase
MSEIDYSEIEQYIPTKFRVSSDDLRTFLKNIQLIRDEEGNVKRVKGVVNASQLIGKTRQWGSYVGRIIEKAMKQPKRIYPEYKDFWEIPEIQKWRKIAKSSDVRALLKMWLIHGRKNPMNWNEDDYITLHNHPQLADPYSKDKAINYHDLEALRHWCKYSKRDLYDRLSTEGAPLHTKGHKRQKGRRRAWFLTPEELQKLLSVITDNIEMLAYVTLQAMTGSRSSGLRYQGFSASKFDLMQNNVTIYESKTGATWTKPINDTIKKVMAEYVRIKGKKADEPLFRPSLQYYNDNLKEYATKAGICLYEKYKKQGHWRYKYISGKPMSTHVLRHTFAFICAINGVTLEKTAELGGWDDLTTLKDFYYYVPPEELRKVYNAINWTKPIPREALSLVEASKAPPTPEELEELEKEE